MGKLIRLVRTAGATRLSVQLIALWKLWRHPQTSPLVKGLSVAVLAYALSPIDLIPDFIPVLGQLDDLILIPLGVALIVRLTPPAHWQARLHEAEISREKLPRWWWGAGLVLALWLALMAFLGWGLIRLVRGA